MSACAVGDAPRIRACGPEATERGACDMRARRAAPRAVSFAVFASLFCFVASRAGAQEPAESAPPPPESEAAPPPPPAEEQPPPAPPAEVKPAPPSSITVGEIEGWRLTIEGRLNSFFSYGWGPQLRRTDPFDGANLGEGTGLGGNQNQTNTSGNFATPRVRNGFLANVLTFKVTRNISSTTRLQAVLSL